MMKKLLAIALLACSETVLASANCQHSQSWQCSQQSGALIGTQLGNNAAGATPSGTSNPGTNTGTQPVNVLPLPGTAQTGDVGTAGRAGRWRW